jgi:hypothetical protein
VRFEISERMGSVRVATTLFGKRMRCSESECNISSVLLTMS